MYTTGFTINDPEYHIYLEIEGGAPCTVIFMRRSVVQDDMHIYPDVV